MTDRERLLDEAKESLKPGAHNAANRILLFGRVIHELNKCVESSKATKDGRFELATAITEFGILIGQTEKALGEWNVGVEIRRRFGEQLKRMRTALEKIERGNSL